jgi:hypothetical protein
MLAFAPRRRVLIAPPPAMALRKIGPRGARVGKFGRVGAKSSRKPAMILRLAARTSRPDFLAVKRRFADRAAIMGATPAASRGFPSFTRHAACPGLGLRLQTMTRIPAPRNRYEALRRGRRTLKFITPLVQLGFLGLGLAIFLDQSRALLSDAQFTWGERRVMGIIALLALGGCGFAGWVVGRLIGVAAELLDVMADSAEAAWRTCDLIERQIAPTLSRIATALEDLQSSNSPDRPSSRGKRT